MAPLQNSVRATLIVIPPARVDLRVVVPGDVTLVIDPKHGALCTVVYALSTRSDPAEAIEDLRCREDTSAEKIGRFLADDPKPDRGQDDAALGKISAWAKKINLDVVLWTALGGNFDADTKKDFVRAAVKYVQELKAEGKAKAAEYVWRAPDFVRTPLREALQKEPWFALEEVVGAGAGYALQQIGERSELCIAGATVIERAVAQEGQLCSMIAELINLRMIELEDAY